MSEFWYSQHEKYKVNKNKKKVLKFYLNLFEEIK